MQSGFISFCFAIPPMSPKSLLDFAHQQRLAIFRAKNKVNIKRRECISHGEA
jgi:hypothetical protein